MLRLLVMPVLVVGPWVNHGRCPWVDHLLVLAIEGLSSVITYR